MAGNTAQDAMWQVMLRSSEMGACEKLHITEVSLSFNLKL